METLLAVFVVTLFPLAAVLALLGLAGWAGATTESSGACGPGSTSCAPPRRRRGWPLDTRLRRARASWSGPSPGSSACAGLSGPRRSRVGEPRDHGVELATPEAVRGDPEDAGRQQRRVVRVAQQDHG